MISANDIDCNYEMKVQSCLEKCIDSKKREIINNSQAILQNIVSPINSEFEQSISKNLKM